MKKIIYCLLFTMGLGFSLPAKSLESDKMIPGLKNTDRVIAQWRPLDRFRPVNPRFVGLIKKGVRAKNPNSSNCVADTRTGLTWERKTNYGMRWWNSSYTNTTNTRLKPTRARGICISEGGNPVVRGNACHTEGYVDYLNNLNGSGLCSFNDWRLPSEREMRTILDANRAPPFFVDRNAFPYARMFNVWTSTRAPGYTFNDQAIRLYLEHVISPVSMPRSTPMAVLLVRGKPLLRRY